MSTSSSSVISVTDYLARSFELLETLQRATTHVPATALADTLGVNTRSVRRLIADLKSIGFGIDSAPGPYGGYQLGPGRKVAPLLPTEAEVVTLLAGLSSSAVASLQDQSVDPGLLSQKLMRLLPEKHRTAIADMATYVVSYQAATLGASAQMVRELAKCCRLRIQLAITYTAHGETWQSLIDPHQLVQNDYLWYLIGWNSAHADWETLRVDRIAGCERTAIRFTPRSHPHTDLAGYTANSIATAAYACRVKATFYAPAAEVATRFPIDAVFVEPIDESSCQVHTGADTYETVAVYLLAANLPFTIDAPEEMRTKMLETAERLRDAAQGSLTGSGGVASTE